MTTYVVFLRAVNVGSHNRIKMADLRSALVADGLGDAITHIQTGNIIASSTDDEEGLRVRVERIIASALGLTVDAMVRTAGDFATIAREHPFQDLSSDLSKLHVTLLAGHGGHGEHGGQAGHQGAAGEDFPTTAWAHSEPPDYWVAQGREIYLYFPDGFKQPKFTGKGVDPRLRRPGTARNWKVIGELAQLVVRFPG